MLCSRDDSTHRRVTVGVRHPHLAASVSTVLIALGLIACGDSEQSGFTTGRPPTKPSDFSTMRPTAEMANETEDLLLDQDPPHYVAPKCVPADSLDGVGEFNFDCVAKDLDRGGWSKLEVVVFGSESGEPDLGPILKYLRPGESPRQALTRRMQSR